MSKGVKPILLLRMQGRVYTCNYHFIQNSKGGRTRIYLIKETLIFFSKPLTIKLTCFALALRHHCWLKGLYRFFFIYIKQPLLLLWSKCHLTSSLSINSSYFDSVIFYLAAFYQAASAARHQSHPITIFPCWVLLFLIVLVLLISEYSPPDNCSQTTTGSSLGYL